MYLIMIKSADYTFRRNNTIHKHDNRISVIIQVHDFTDQLNHNTELYIQLLNSMIVYLQIQINNIDNNSTPPSDNEQDIGYA